MIRRFSARTVGPSVRPVTGSGTLAWKASSALRVERPNTAARCSS